MRAARLLSTVLMVVTLTAGCGAGPDWFNNEPEPACASHAIPAGQDPQNQANVIGSGGWDRPSIPAGWAWIVIRLDVTGIARVDDATGVQVTNNRYCLPVDLHITADSNEADTWLTNGPTNDFLTSGTPWVGRVTLAYDPSEERFAGRPPSYTITVTATYRDDLDAIMQATPDPEGIVRPAGIGCRIAVANPMGGAYGQGSYPAAETMAGAFALFPAQREAHCEYSGNRFNH